MAKIKRLNKKLNELNAEKLEVIKKRQLLEISEEKAKEKLKVFQKKFEKLKRKYKKILKIN